MKVVNLSIDGKVFLSYQINESIDPAVVIDKCARILDRFAAVKVASTSELAKSEMSAKWDMFIEAMAQEHDVPPATIVGFKKTLKGPILRRLVFAAWRDITLECWHLIAARADRDRSSVYNSEEWIHNHPEHAAAFSRTKDICKQIVNFPSNPIL